MIKYTENLERRHWRSAADWCRSH